MTKESILLQLSLYAIEYAELIQRGKWEDAREYEKMSQELIDKYSNLF